MAPSIHDLFQNPNYPNFQTLPKYSDWGCYPLFYITEHCDVLCADCATDALWESADCDSKDNPSAVDVNYENPELYCDQCSMRIESAYAEDDAEKES